MSKAPLIDDPVRRLIADAIHDQALDYATLSREFGVNPTYVQQFLKKGTPRTLPEDIRRKFAERLGIPESKLIAPGRTPAPRKRTPPNANLGGPVDVYGSQTLPVFGEAVGGADGRFILNGTRVADILAPAELAAVRDAYAVYVSGTSMEPRYYPGETLYIHPHLPVRKGDYVVVQIEPEEDGVVQGFVKQFISRDDRRLRLSQLNPKRTIEFPGRDVKAVHVVLFSRRP